MDSSNGFTQHRGGSSPHPRPGGSTAGITGRVGYIARCNRAKIQWRRTEHRA